MASHIGRRKFLAALGGSAAAWPLAARAQQSALPVIGFLNGQSPDNSAHLVEAFRQGLKQTGYVEGRNATRIGVLWNPTTPSQVPGMESVEAAGKRLGLELHLVSAATVEDFDGTFASMARENVGGVFVVPAPITLMQRARLAELALKHRLPTMFGAKENVEAGGLMSYGADRTDLIRRAVVYIDKILKGAKPADLPVEQASKYQLVINLKTAKALGLEIPPTLLARADEVVE
jgi:putative ABC transport system substrate-binding protein